MWTSNILHDYMETFYGIAIVFCLSYMGNSFKRLFCHFFLTYSLQVQYQELQNHVSKLPSTESLERCS